MTERSKAKPKGWLITIGAAGLMLAVILALNLMAKNANRQYEIESAITLAPTMAPPTLFARATDTLLRNGSVGPEVKQLQERLKELKYYNTEVDGAYGPATKAAVQRFQEQHGLNPDGKAGPETMSLLYSASAQEHRVTPKPALPSSSGSLPLLVNKQKPLPEDYEPTDLVALKDTVPKDLMILKNPDVMAKREAVDALIQMIKAAQADGLEVWQVSEGYRTIARQQELFDEQVRIYMKDDGLTEEQARSATEKTVARPGTSEHHTGLAFDLTVPGYFFGDTPQAQWLEDHCWDYGFILRYTSNKEEITGFLPEPWHVRYVGKAEAQFMDQHNLALEEYLALYN